MHLNRARVFRQHQHQHQQRQRQRQRHQRPPSAGLQARAALATTLLVAGALSLIASQPAQAAGIVDLDSRISVGNLRFAFSDPAAVLNWELDWYGEVGAYAHNAGGGEDTGYWFVIGNSDSTATAAQVSGSRAQSDYRVVDGAGVAIAPDASVAAGARTGIALQRGSQQADGYAYANLNNYFSISSPSPTGQTVSATISLDYTGLAEVSANPGASFELLLAAVLALYDIDDTTGGLLEPALGADDWRWGYVGRGLSLNAPLDGTLAIIVDIPYDDLHWLYAAVESAAYGVPIAGALPLMLTGCGVLVWGKRRRRSCRRAP